MFHGYYDVRRPLLCCRKTSASTGYKIQRKENQREDRGNETAKNNRKSEREREGGEGTKHKRRQEEE
ncbi:hypothetical protein NC651_028747 [Populus alba x Populus x berolinensis]|nr:hypothetical protein NC651_028747 [Populus alba x Populus x berolinensis]